MFVWVKKFFQLFLLGMFVAYVTKAFTKKKSYLDTLVKISKTLNFKFDQFFQERFEQRAQINSNKSNS